MPHDYKAPRRSNENPIANARLEKGITQSELAKALGISQQQLSSWEVGKFSVPIATLKQIAEILDVDVVTLIDQPTKKERNNIAAIRKEKGLTQTELAKELGVSQGILSKYETGTHLMPDELLNKAAEILGVTVDRIKPED